MSPLKQQTFHFINYWMPTKGDHFATSRNSNNFGSFEEPLLCALGTNGGCSQVQSMHSVILFTRIKILNYQHIQFYAKYNILVSSL